MRASTERMGETGYVGSGERRATGQYGWVEGGGEVRHTPSRCMLPSFNSLPGLVRLDFAEDGSVLVRTPYTIVGRG